MRYNHLMRTACKLMSAGKVWLAAALVLFANVPHFVCQCPDGHVKPFCFGAARGSECCCGSGGCCRPPAPRQHAAPCCAASHEPQRPPSSGSCHGANGCARTVAQAENYAPTTGQGTTYRPDLVVTTLLPPPTSTPDGPTVARGSSAWRADHSLSPPPDLVKLLQHFLI
jgi:hypothetical protein